MAFKQPIRCFSWTIAQEARARLPKTLMKALQQGPVIVKQWIEEEYPTIKQLARQQRAEIYFED